MQSQTYFTDDLALAAYFLLNDLIMKGFENHKKHRGKVIFEFDDSESCRQLALKYANSECSKFDAHKRTLKKICSPPTRGRAK